MNKSKLKNVFRGLSMICATGLAVSIVAGQVMETYWPQMDTIMDTVSYETITDAENSDTEWKFESQFKTPTEAVNGLKEFAIRESVETLALLKNENNALPLKKDAKITLLGVRSYAPVYGGSAGSIAGFPEVMDGNKIYEAFAGRGFKINPSMLKAYENHFADETYGVKGFVSTAPSYRSITNYTDANEVSLATLEGDYSDYAKDNASYNDAAVLVFGRPGGENGSWYPGTYEGKSNTGNVLGLSNEELALVSYAKANFNKVIVLINAGNTMDIADIAATKTASNYGVDSILWIGYPGSYGFWGVADVLNGTVSPSGHLGDTFAKNNALAPAMMNVNNMTPWTDPDASAVYKNSYLIEAEGIYTGYRYYETRYADIVNGVANASKAAAGTYANANGTPATQEGTWSYENEVVYTFGQGLSYADFTQEITGVNIANDKKTAAVTVKVTNSDKSSYSGKSVIQLYGQAPYIKGVEKSAIQLLDYEKTKTLEPGESQTITLFVDMANIASYNMNARNGKGGFVIDAGDYYFSIGDNAHDALNNILKAQGKNVDGNASKTYRWTWEKDEETFSVAYSGVEIENHLSSGIYAMDYNYFEPGTVTYLSRSDWYGTFPKTYTGLTGKAHADLVAALSNEFIEYKTNAQEGQFVWGSTETDWTIFDLIDVEWNDSRLDELVDQVSIEEYLKFVPLGLHKFNALPSIGIETGLKTDDGPGGADENYIGKNGSYHGKKYSEMEDYQEKWNEFGTRVAPAPINLAYSWNKELAFENGQLILGESQLMFGLALMIGPGVNIHRHGYNARGFEYYSEDPILSGYTGSAVVQGAQDKGCLVNIKHAAFNDQEVNRSGVAVFTSEQAARELELRNLQQIFTAQGKPAAWVRDNSYDNTYTEGALGLMTSYNRIGAVYSSANEGVMVDILRNEWGFKGFSQTDMGGVNKNAAPHESLLHGLTAFCGRGDAVAYFQNVDIEADAEFSQAIKNNIKYVCYALTRTAMINAPQHLEWRLSSWRQMYYSFIGITAGLTALSLGAYVTFAILSRKEEV